jgi:hypothetical protein
MKSTLLLLALGLAATPFIVAQTPDGFAHPAPRLYELYSWPESDRIWNFCLLPSPSGVNIPVGRIFNKKFRVTGLDQLKRMIPLLPTGTRILWMNGITSGQTPTAESKKLALPPVKTVKQVKRFASAHGVQVEVPSSSPD